MGVVVTVCMWLASLYRLLVSAREPPTPWRSAYTVGVVSMTLATTLHYFDRPLDHRLGSVNLARLLADCLYVTCAAAVTMYVEWLNRSEPRPAVVRAIAASGVVTAVVLALLWRAGDIHRDVDLALLAPDTPMALYYLLYYLYLGTASAVVAVFCVRSAAATDIPAQKVSLAVIGLSSGGGSAMMLVFLIANEIRGHSPQLSATLMLDGARVLDPALAALALGVLSVSVTPWLTSLVQSYRRCRVLRPLWRDLTAQRPDLRLNPPRSIDPLKRLELREQRYITEMHDALRARLVAVEPGGGPQVLAAALRRSPEHHDSEATPVPGSLALRPGTDMLDDRNQLLELARAYAKADPRTTR